MTRTREEAIKQCEDFIENHSEWSVEVEWANGVEFVLEDYKRLIEQEPTTRNCFGCKYSKNNHNQDIEECHLCMWENQYTPTIKNDDLALIHTWGLDEEIRCIMCTNSMKSNRGCNGSCVVNKDMYKAVVDAIEKRIQPTTKNNLGVDCISRADAIRVASGYCHPSNVAKELAKLPSVTPQEPRKGHWINTANPRMSDNIVCSECGYDSIADFKFCPCCGADMREVKE